MIKMKVTTKFHAAAVMSAVNQAKIEPLMKCGALVERESKLSMKEGGGHDRTPSAPGTPPRVQTGGLRNSITHAYDNSVKTVLVGTTIKKAGFPYPKVHEEGVRQFMKPALARAAPRFKQFFRNAFNLKHTAAGASVAQAAHKAKESA